MVTVDADYDADDDQYDDGGNDQDDDGRWVSSRVFFIESMKVHQSKMEWMIVSNHYIVNDCGGGFVVHIFGAGVGGGDMWRIIAVGWCVLDNSGVMGISHRDIFLIVGWCARWKVDVYLVWMMG